MMELLQSALLIVEEKKKKRRRRMKRGGREKEEEKEGEGGGEGGRKKEKRRRGKEGEEERWKGRERGEVVDKKCAQFTHCLNVSCMELGSRGKKCQTGMCVNYVLVG